MGSVVGKIVKVNVGASVGWGMLLGKIVASVPGIGNGGTGAMVGDIVDPTVGLGSGIMVGAPVKTSVGVCVTLVGNVGDIVEPNVGDVVGTAVGDMVDPNVGVGTLVLFGALVVSGFIEGETVDPSGNVGVGTRTGTSVISVEGVLPASGLHVRVGRLGELVYKGRNVGALERPDLVGWDVGLPLWFVATDGVAVCVIPVNNTQC